MLPATVERIFKDIPEVVAVKEASGNVSQCIEILDRTDGKIDLLSGDDSLYFALLAIGGKGVISVVSNIIPHDVAEVYNKFAAGNYKEARDLFYKYFYLTKSMFYETNPIPVKTSLKLMGKINGELRLPLCEMKKENLEKLEKDLKRYGLI